MVDVEQDALRALEQDALAGSQSVVEIAPHRPREGQHEIGDFGQVVKQPFAVDRRLVEAGAKRVVVRTQHEGPRALAEVDDRPPGPRPEKLDEALGVWEDALANVLGS